MSVIGWDMHSKLLIVDLLIKSYAYRRQSGELFHFYLSNSKDVNEAMSSLLPFISGVPQGYVFHPFVFCTMHKLYF